MTSSNPPSQPASTPSQPPPTRLQPQTIIIIGIKTNNLAEISQTLKDHPDLLPWTLSKTLSQNNLTILEHLISHHHAPISTLSPRQIAAHPSVPLFNLLLTNNWDINQHDPSPTGTPGPTLLHHICANESLVRYLLAHNASTTDPHTDPYSNPPLVETVAATGTVSSLKLFINHGAQLSRRTLHRAVGAVAGNKRDDLRARMAMVEYLVDELELDVNALDAEEKLPEHWGTPLCYAAHNARGGEEVVRFLLERGADPRIRDCWGNWDAIELAAKMGNEGVERLLREWEVQRGGR